MESTNPLVTVGIPTYNRPEGLKRTLDCISSQSYGNLEILVSDNCSTNPEVRPVLSMFSEKDKRVSYFIQPRNLSIVPNFQFLLDKAKGEYFMWAADDDFWDPDFIETCLKGMHEREDVAVCISDLKFISEHREVKASKLNRSFDQQAITRRSFSFVKSTADNRYFFCGLYRTSLARSTPFPNRWGGDQLFLYEMLTKGKLLYLPGQSSIYYYRGGSSKGLEGVRKAFNIKNRFYYFDAYVFKFLTYQFRFKHLSILTRVGLFFSNLGGLLFNEDFILYYVFIKKPVRFFARKLKFFFKRGSNK